MLDINVTLSLIKKAKQDDNSAKEKLITENSPLIKSVIKRYINKGIEYEDLYQLGSLGFLKAITNFDQSFNVKFSTYAVPMIAGEVKRFMRDNGIIKVSRSVKTLNININKYIEEYTTENNKSPHIDQIAKHFNLPNQDIVFAMESNKQLISLTSAVGEDEGNKELHLIEKIENENLDNKLDNMLLYNIINSLCAKDKKIIILRYFRDKTQKEIADELGVSQVQVSRLENKILSKLKEQFIND